jgi:long-subunit fatty acid transport protein
VGVANRTALTFTLHHRPSYNMSIGLFAGFFRNRADADQFSANEIDLFSITIRPTIHWKFYDNFTLEGGYMFSYFDNKADDTKTDRNFVFLQITYGIPLPDPGRIFN